MAGYLRIRNWEKYQHYKDRKPIWIKLHIDMLDDEKLRSLPVPTRLLWDQLLLLAARYGNPVEDDANGIAKLTRMPLRSVRAVVERQRQKELLR
jgi:hypothetical protein